MSLSSWYANIVLPGSNAFEVTLGEGFSTKFDWENKETTDKISYCLSLDVNNSTDNPLEGRDKNVIMSGVKNFVISNRKYDNLFNAVRVFESKSSSSSSSSSSSLSSSSSSLSSSSYSSSSSSYSSSSSSYSSSSFSSSSSSYSSSSFSSSSSSYSSSSFSSSSSSYSSSSFSSSSFSSSSSSQSSSSYSLSSSSSSTSDFCILEIPAPYYSETPCGNCCGGEDKKTPEVIWLDITGLPNGGLPSCAPSCSSVYGEGTQCYCIGNSWGWLLDLTLIPGTCTWTKDVILPVINYTEYDPSGDCYCGDPSYTNPHTFTISARKSGIPGAYTWQVWGQANMGGSPPSAFFILNAITDPISNADCYNSVEITQIEDCHWADMGHANTYLFAIEGGVLKLIWNP